jgi:hypothetical protein
MKGRTSAVMATLLAVFLMTTSYGIAASTTKLTFSESLADKVKCSSEDGEKWCEQLEFGKFSVSASIPATGININEIDDDTEFSLDINGALYNFTPGEDPKYTAEKTSAKSSTLMKILMERW